MIEDYTEKMSVELRHLNKEDQTYVKKMVAYIGVKSFFMMMSYWVNSSTIWFAI